jgi:hypothetical protein
MPSPIFIARAIKAADRPQRRAERQHLDDGNAIGPFGAVEDSHEFRRDKAKPYSNGQAESGEKRGDVERNLTQFFGIVLEFEKSRHQPCFFR